MDIGIEVRQGEAQSKAKIVVIGTGGAGNHAINNMVDADMDDEVQLIGANTDSQALELCKAATKIQLGEKLTGGLGAGSNPEVGEKAAEESEDDIAAAIKGADMLFVTCGMGGGTGTGSAPVIAQLAKEQGILTVGIVSKPFSLEGKAKLVKAEQGIEKLSQAVDTLIVVPNDRVMQICPRNTSFENGLKKANEILQQSVQGITDIINKSGVVNVDFADVRTVMKDKGVAHIGIGYGKGDERAQEAIKMAVESPLLETTIDGATDLLVSFRGDVGLQDAQDAMQYVWSLVDENANVKVGIANDESMKDEIAVTLIATGLEAPAENNNGAGLFGKMTYAPHTTPSGSRVSSGAASSYTRPTVPKPSVRPVETPHPAQNGTQRTVGVSSLNPQREFQKTLNTPVQPTSTVKETNIKVPDFLSGRTRK